MDRPLAVVAERPRLGGRGAEAVLVLDREIGAVDRRKAGGAGVDEDGLTSEVPAVPRVVRGGGATERGGEVGEADDQGLEPLRGGCDLADGDEPRGGLDQGLDPDLAGERFDEWRLLETIETARGGTAQELVAALADTVCAFQEPSPPVDDITIVAIRRLPAA